MKKRVSDKERLDWLQKKMAGIFWTYGVCNIGETIGLDVRETIDAAMKRRAKRGRE